MVTRLLGLMRVGVLFVVFAGTAWAEIVVDADYPGGNIVFEAINGDTVRLHQDLRDTKGWWFYWNFRVRGAAGRMLTFRFTNKNVIGTRGPALSLDEGRSWTWLGMDTVQGDKTGVSFRYAFAADAHSVRFAFALPYQEADLERFLDGYPGNPHLQTKEFCQTRKGRTIKRLHVGKVDGAPNHRILLTARHHACESVANYVLEGIIAAMLADTDDGRWFREHVETLAVPFMDQDGVEDGDQGKNREPRDHNRDYNPPQIYSSTRTLCAFAPQWSQGVLRIALDLHCPYIRGDNNETIYLVGTENQDNWNEQTRFSAILESTAKGSLPYHAADNLPFGQGWNTASNYEAGVSFQRWAVTLDGIRLVSTIEIPYANVGEVTQSPERARAFGADLTRAMRRYLETLE